MSTPSLRRFSLLATSAVVCLFAACSASTGTGSATIGLTDAVNDDLDTFEVDVRDISFTRLDGNTVSVLSRSTRVDFAALESLSELFVGVAMPAGIYTGAQMTLDFTNAVVDLKGKTTPATVLDANGTPITGTVPVHISFAGNARPEIFVNRRHIFELDLDLDSAITVDLTGNSVTFDPVMIAKLDPTNPKPAGVSGVLTSVNVAARTFALDKRALDNTTICSFTVAAASNTVFQIDGTVYAGFGGLATLANQSLGAAHVFVQGTYGTGAHTINALAVESGSGVPGNGQSWVVGHVVGRDHTAGQDATLSVLGHSLDVGSGTRLYNTLHTVQVALGTTKVLRFGAGNSLTTDALQVGQRVAVFGTLTGTNLDARGVGATPDVARILFTSVFGIATGAPVGNTLTIDVARFDLRLISDFNFSVGGITESDPHAYTVDVTGLSTSGITTNSRVRCTGWANPVGVAGDSDFQSISLVDRGVDGKAMLCFWSPANAQALPSVSSTAIGLDVSAAAVKVVSDGFTTTGINTSPTPSLEPFTSLGFYLIVQNGGIELHLQFAPFTTSLSNRLLAGAAVRRVSALGRYDAPSQTFAALVSTVVLQ